MRTISLFTLLCAALLAHFTTAAMTVGELRCDYAADPIGIDTRRPQLSWKLFDTARGQLQTAYQIRAAETPEDLEKGKNLLWDTGKVTCSDNVQIPYEGANLHSGMRTCWQVRAWDRRGKATSWSKPAVWQVALLDAADWKAKWIAPAASGTPEWRDFTFSADVVLQKEACGLVFRAPDTANGYMWQINTAIGPEILLRPHVQKNGQWSMLPSVSLRTFIPSGDEHKPHHIEIEVRGAVIRTRIDGKLVDERTDNTFSSGTVGFRASSDERATVDNVTVVDAAGKELLRETFDGKTAAFPKARIENGQLALTGAFLLHRLPLPKDCPRLRKTFTLDKPVKRATASICGLGFYELYLNGRKVGTRVLAPPNTPYSSRVLFDTYDVTPLLRQGANAAGIWLAPGYSDDYSKWGWKWEENKRAILQLDVVFQDGAAASVVTDSSWLSGDSPLTYASLYNGEIYDAARETPGWSETGFDAAGWQAVRAATPLQAKLLPNIMPPVRVLQTIRPVAVKEPKPGVFVFDMGQNFSGWVRIRAKGPRGTRITLRHSELIGPDGMLDPWTNRRAKATDTFILAGGETENHEPRFTYHGFRFVEVTGYPGRPSLDDITGCFVHADVQPAGSFASSDATINQIYSNCLWSMRSNFMGIPTDCCMRDERTPCQMDSLAYEDNAFWNFDMNRFYTKWLDDITGGRGNPDWNGDMVFLPWRLYRYDGDIGILERHYANMRAFVDALDKKTPGHVYTDGFGDWCPPSDGTWEGYHGDVTEVNTCLYAKLARIMSDTATLLGKPDDAARFARLADAIVRAFNEKRCNAKQAIYGDGSQTTALLPLAFGLVPEDRRQAVFDKLVDTIRTKNQGRLDTGIFGTRYLTDVLCDFGQADLAIDMLTQPEYPGFGFQIAHGATTLWEQWTFKGGMNSHNHAMFAGVGASFFSRLAGITALKPGFSEIGIRPFLPKRLTFVEAAHETVRGRVAVKWQRENGDVTMLVTIPVNATARIALPTADRNAVKADGGTCTGTDDGRVIYTAGSGTYTFTWKE